MAAIKTSDYISLTQKLNEWYNEASVERVADWVGKTLFDVGETDWRVYDYLITYGAGKFDEIAEGAQLPVATSVEGDSTTATQRRFGGRVGITKDMRMFNRYDRMEDAVKDEVNIAWDKIDQSQADMLTNGFSGTSFTDIYGFTQTNTSPDAVVFFSASHTNNQDGNTARNLIRNSAGTANPALARDPIVKARSDGRTHTAPSDGTYSVNRPINLDTIVVSEANDDIARRIIFSQGVQGTPNVDNNPLTAKVKNIITWSRLDTRGDGTDTSAYWFFADSRNIKKTLKSPFAQRPMMGAATMVHDSLTWEYPLDAYYTLFIGQPFNMWGSTGTA